MPSHIKIQKRRFHLGISLATLAERLRTYDRDLFGGFTASRLSEIENGKRRVLANELRGFAIALECRVADLVDEVDEH